MAAADDDDKPAAKGKKGKDKKEKGGKSNLVPAIIIAVGLIGGGKMMGGGGAAPAAAAAEAPAHAEEEHELDCAAQDLQKAPKEGALVTLDPQSVNLADGHFLKVGIALQLSTAENAEHFEKEGLGAKALDQVIAVMGGRSIAELQDPESAAVVKELLTDEIRPLYHCNVIKVLFTEFVMQ